MNFYEKVDNIIVTLKDINKMYFSLKKKNTSLAGRAGLAGAGHAGHAGAGHAGADVRAAGVSGSTPNLSNNQWPSSLRARWC